MIKPTIETIKGIAPIYKEAGISCFTLVQWIKLHIAYETPWTRTRYLPHVEVFRSIDPFSSGVLTFAVGKPSLYIKYLKYCDCRYTIDLRMGQSTATDYYKSPPLNTKPYDHVKSDDVKNTCQLFIGDQVQLYPAVVFVKPRGTLADDEDENQINENLTNFLDLDNQLRFKERNCPQHRQVTCKSIDIIKFDPPYLTLEINCCSRFSLRSFIRDFFNRLDTCGVFVKVHRSQEGPFTVHQCINQTDLCVKYLNPALLKYTTTFIDHVRPHLDKMPFYNERLSKKH